MPITVAECSKEFLRGDDLAWIKPPEQKVERSKQSDEMWNRSSRATFISEKHAAYTWASRVREQYEPAKRTLRFYRWHSRPRYETPAARLFQREAERWKEDSMHWSSMSRIVSHPSYLRIIGLAGQAKEREIEKLILAEMESEPYHWFDALEAITGQNPVRPEDDFDAAVNAWLEWGRQEGIVAHDNAGRVER